MVAARYGRIVNVASNDAYVAKPALAHYAAAKAAVVSLTKSLAAELAPHQVLVNAVSPGAIATETAKSQDCASPRNRFLAGETVIANGGMLML
jgi:3-oxoacyl-[acyl-carrier protein] reductase